MATAEADRLMLTTCSLPSPFVSAYLFSVLFQTESDSFRLFGFDPKTTSGLSAEITETRKQREREREREKVEVAVTVCMCVYPLRPHPSLSASRKIKFVLCCPLLNTKRKVLEAGSLMPLYSTQLSSDKREMKPNQARQSSGTV